MPRKKWTDRLPDLFGRRRIFALECDLEEAQGQIEELQGYGEVVAEDFEKDCWKSMRHLLDTCHFDWREVGMDGVTALQAEEFILSFIRDLEERYASALVPAPAIPADQKPIAYGVLDRFSPYTGQTLLFAGSTVVSVLDADRFELTPLYASPQPTITLSEDSLFTVLHKQSWDLRCFSYPTGGDDHEIGWRVVGHWMAEPQERVIAEIWRDDPAAAVREAISRGTRND